MLLMQLPIPEQHDRAEEEHVNHHDQQNGAGSEGGGVDSSEVATSDEGCANGGLHHHVHDDDDDVNELAKVRRPSSKNSQEGSIRRKESWESFLARSQRSERLGKDQPPSPAEASRRAVQFIPDPMQLAAVVVVEPVSDDDKPNYWFDDNDFERMEKDIKVTLWRLDNHLSGRIAFDEDNNTTRGLEYLVDRGNKNNDCEQCKQPEERPETRRWKHAQLVLQEIHNQKLTGRVDWERVRQVSQSRSMEDFTKAHEMGKADERARQQSWGNVGTGGLDQVMADFVPAVTKAPTPGARKARGGLRKGPSKKKPGATGQGGEREKQPWRGLLSWIPGKKTEK